MFRSSSHITIYWRRECDYSKVPALALNFNNDVLRFELPPLFIFIEENEILFQHSTKKLRYHMFKHLAVFMYCFLLMVTYGASRRTFNIANCVLSTSKYDACLEVIIEFFRISPSFIFLCEWICNCCVCFYYGYYWWYIRVWKKMWLSVCCILRCGAKNPSSCLAQLFSRLASFFVKTENEH